MTWPLWCSTLGLLPPIAPGRMEPVSWYLHKILDTHPCETRSCREMTHGRMPWWAISTILWRMWLGKGRPFMKTPPSWFTRPWPKGVETVAKEEKSANDIVCKRQPFAKRESRIVKISLWLTWNKHYTAIKLLLMILIISYSYIRIITTNNHNNKKLVCLWNVNR